MDHAFSFRRFAYAVSAMAVVLGIGTVGFRSTIGEPWLQSFYRAVVSSTLTGLDTVPKNDGARLITIFLVLAGISIFAYIGSLVVEAIARGVIGGLWAERRRRKAIEALHDHYVIVALRKRDGTFDTTPTPEAALEVGDVLVAAGTEEELRALERLFAPRETVVR